MSLLLNVLIPASGNAFTDFTFLVLNVIIYTYSRGFIQAANLNTNGTYICPIPVKKFMSGIDTSGILCC